MSDKILFFVFQRRYLIYDRIVQMKTVLLTVHRIQNVLETWKITRDYNRVLCTADLINRCVVDHDIIGRILEGFLKYNIGIKVKETVR